MTSEIADRIEILWKEEAIRLVFEMRAKLRIADTCDHFWNDVRRISAPDYVPTEQDILLVCHRTTGAVEREFQINKYMFTFIDTGDKDWSGKMDPLLLKIQMLSYL